VCLVPISLVSVCQSDGLIVDCLTSSNGDLLPAIKFATLILLDPPEYARIFAAGPQGLASGH
jgi:hypothetical protein